jgi:hypothetical protein
VRCVGPRLAEPGVLVKNAAGWIAAHLQRPSERPPHRRYGHEDVRIALRAMSFHKCFYCEQRVSRGDEEVDHHIEAAERPDLAFTWTNLYLACTGCNNGKPSNAALPVARCVDPCDPTQDPDAHLLWRDEYVAERAHSARGLDTIRKYRLDRPELEGSRTKQLRLFDTAHREILLRMNAQGRAAMNPAEVELLRSFASPTQPFSAMFHAYLTRLGL